MNDSKVYGLWVAAYTAIDRRYMSGGIDLGEYDRLVRNLEERLGVGEWPPERWTAAAECWQATGEGA